MGGTAAPQSRETLEAWVDFLMFRPWNFEHEGQVRFSGLETAWAFALGSVLYLKGYAAAGGTGRGNDGVGNFTIGATSFTSLFLAFETAMSQLGEDYEYPGCAPSMKYSIVSSRSYYLAHLLKDAGDAVLALLRTIVKMVSCR